MIGYLQCRNVQEKTTLKIGENYCFIHLQFMRLDAKTARVEVKCISQFLKTNVI